VQHFIVCQLWLCRALTVLIGTLYSKFLNIAQNWQKLRTESAKAFHKIPRTNSIITETFGLWPFNPKIISQVLSLHKVWTLWDHSFLSYHAYRQTDRQTYTHRRITIRDPWFNCLVNCDSWSTRIMQQLSSGLGSTTYHPNRYTHNSDVKREAAHQPDHIQSRWQKVQTAGWRSPESRNVLWQNTQRTSLA